MSAHQVAPALLFRGASAVAEATGAIATLGVRPLLVHGDLGAADVEPRVKMGLVEAGADPAVASHSGPCSDASIAAIIEAAARTNADVIVGIGGGRVLDAAKAAADESSRPFAAIPTSPATCAAVTPLAVVYTPAGAYLRTQPTRRPPDVAALDPTCLAAAPDRLLVAGIVDALAKVHEVRHTLGNAVCHDASARAALALCTDLEALINARALDAVAPVDLQLPGRQEARELLAEACVLAPGLIGGLAGEAAKLAAAHPLHNALTHLPGSHHALHGELVGFGVLVQIHLGGGGEADVRREARLYARLGLACHLRALGCADALGTAVEEVCERTVAMAPMMSAFPRVTAAGLADALRTVNGWAFDEAAVHALMPPGETD